MLIYLQWMESAADQSNFERLYLQYRGLMFHIAFQILRNPEDAEDAVHEAFLSIAKNMDKILDPLCTKTKVYVVTIAENKTIDLYRSKRRKSTEALQEEAAGIPIDVPGGGLAAAIAKLPARYRAFVLLKYDCGYTNQELAELLGLSYEGVHSLDHRAKTKLKELLKEEDATV